MSLGAFAIRALRITASTITFIELIKSDWYGGCISASAWILFIIVERRLPRDIDEK